MGTMKDTHEGSEIRQRAEKKLAIKAVSTEPLSEMTLEKTASLIHELQVHQIELEMQNDELRRIQDELEETRDRYSHLYDFAPIGYFALNQKGIINEANLTIAAMLGVDRSALIGQPFTRFILRDDKDTFYKHRQQLLEIEAPQSCELRLVKKDGHVFYARLECTTITNKGEDGKQIRAAVSDITERNQAEEALLKAHCELERRVEKRTAELTKTNHELTGEIDERKQAEEALRKSEKKFSTLFHSSPVYIAFTALDDGCFLDVNGAFERITGYQRDEVLGRTPVEIGLWCEPEERGRFIKLARQNGGFHEEEVRFRRKNGDVLFGIWSAEKAELGDKTCLISALVDVTARRGAEKALRESEEKYRVLFEGITHGVLGIDLETRRFLFANPSICRMLGYSEGELLQLGVADIHPKDSLDHVISEISSQDRGEKPLSLDIPCLRKDGSVFYADIAGSVTEVHGRRCIVGFFMDITERRKLQSQLQQSRKMEAVGTLAGGIAHDFNNILAIILGYAELASNDVPESNPISGALKEIFKASIRARDMIRQLLTFSRKAEEERSPIDMAPILKESMKMLRCAIPASVGFTLHISSDVYDVLGDAAQINQIAMNLVTNAADAMSEEGGILEVTLGNILLQKEKVCLDRVLSPGSYVRLRMKDTGEGIEPEIMDRIFEPYFTTKQVGKGTGMGLSVVHGIVKRNGGGLLVESEPGKGTVFEIYFPALEMKAEEEKEPDGKIEGGSERILFVDDEESMVNLNRIRLEQLGYQVKSTTKPVEALEWFKADPDQFDVIITDMTMPRMSGDRLAAEVLKIRPHMPVIICTGYSERMCAKKAEILGLRKYIEKPIDLRNLASALRDVLDVK